MNLLDENLICPYTPYFSIPVIAWLEWHIAYGVMNLILCMTEELRTSSSNHGNVLRVFPQCLEDIWLDEPRAVHEEDLCEQDGQGDGQEEAGEQENLKTNPSK